MPIGLGAGLGLGGGKPATSSGAPGGGGGGSFKVTRQDDLVGWWKFDENTATTAADSIGSNDAVLYGDATWHPGKNGSALQCDGTDSYAYTGSGSGPTVGDNSTMSFWIRLNDKNTDGWISSRDYSGNPSFLVWASNSQVSVYSNGPATTWGTSEGYNNITSGIWYLLTFVYNGTSNTVAAYLNGTALTGTASVSSNPMADFADGVVFGTYVSGGSPVTGNTLDGEIDDVRIYNAALSASNVSSIWNGGEGDWDLNGGKFLNTYTDAAIAYSLRLLNGNYASSCIKVRRSSDDATQDIGFTSGVLDTSALETFVGSGNDGFIHTWYDQSDNDNNATQTDTAKQPKIVSSGSTLTSGGKPAIEFSSDRLDIQHLTFNLTLAQSVMAVCEMDTSSATEGHIIGVGSSGSGFIHNYGDKLGADQNGSDLELIYESGSGSGPTIQNPTNITDDAIMLALFTNDGTTNNLSLNDGAPTSNTTSLNPYTGYNKATIGAGDGSGSNAVASAWDGKISECIQWRNSQDGNRSGIKTDINNFYSIW